MAGLDRLWKKRGNVRSWSGFRIASILVPMLILPKPILLVLLLAVSPAGANELPLDGTFGFDWLRPKKSKCVKIEGALLGKLRKDYSCVAPDTGSASGQPIVAQCKANKGKSEYMLLKSAAACQEERETQLANGD